LSKKICKKNKLFQRNYIRERNLTVEGGLKNINKYQVNLLKKERDFLLNEWAKATDRDKVNILVKIMDIDENLNDHTIAREKRKKVI
jgi:hypothetical protein